MLTLIIVTQEKIQAESTLSQHQRKQRLPPTARTLYDMAIFRATLKINTLIFV
ncbi:MAG: hypothetical protein AAGL17_12040 [Cyanobacteria bacterium J06576_12]